MLGDTGDRGGIDDDRDAKGGRGGNLESESRFPRSPGCCGTGESPVSWNDDSMN